MQIIFRDDIGSVMVSVSGEITFDGMYAYFNDTQERDYKVAIKNIIEIRKGNVK